MTSTHRIGTSVALALVFAVSAASATARPFDLNANGSYVPAGSASTQAHSQPTTPAGVPPILPVATPPQQAALRHAEQQERLAYLAHHERTGARYSSAEMSAYAPNIPTAVPSTVVHLASHDGSFDWGDAGIGAAGGLGLTLIAVAGAFAISQQRRSRRSKETAAITS